MSNCAQERIHIDCQCVTDPVIAPQEVLCGEQLLFVQVFVII